MSDSSNVQPCPEPTPYSANYSTVADVDFVSTPSAIFTTQPTFSSVDSILANQLGPITNPVTSNTNNVVPVSIPSVLPTQNVNNVVPIVSASMGADINLSSTLNQPNNSNFMPVDNVISNNLSPVNTQLKVPVPTVIPPTPIESFTSNVHKPMPNVQNPMPSVQNPMPTVQNPMPTVEKPIAYIPIESFKNVNNNPQQKFLKDSIRKFMKDITNTKNTIALQKEHFGRKRKEHFGNGKSTLDIILLIILIGTLGIYVYTAWTPELDSQLQKSLRKMWPYTSLHDAEITDNHKLIIILSIILVFIVLIRVL